MILFQVNIITDKKNLLTVMKLQPLILIQFIPKAYKDVSKSSRTVPVKRSFLALDVKFLHHLQSTPLFARIQRSQRFCHAWKHPWKSLFGILSSTRCDSSWISSMVSNLRPFIRSFRLGKRKKSQGARSGEYGGWGTTVMLFLAKNCETLKDLWAGALSW